MKTLYITRETGRIIVDTETNETFELRNSRQAINNIYRAEYDMHVVYGNGENREEFDVTTGDIIVVFYETEFPHKVITVKSDKWNENLDAYEAYEQKQKEEWALKNAGRELTTCDNG